MACKDYESRLHDLEDYVMESLDAPTRAQVAAHLQLCPACHEAVEAAREATVLLRAASLESTPEPGLGFWTRLSARIREEEAAAVDFWRTLEAFSWRMSWSAAVVLVLLGVYLVSFDVSRNHQLQVPPQTAEVREIFPEPAQQPVDREDVLLTLASSGNGR